MFDVLDNGSNGKAYSTRGSKFNGPLLVCLYEFIRKKVE
jgi:hypothetical protein